MPEIFVDQDYLQKQQYRQGNNLDAQRIPLPEHSFDLILVNHLLYHVPEKELAITETRWVLKPGGKLCSATKGFGHLVKGYSTAPEGMA